jgi:hypothetical protein
MAVNQRQLHVCVNRLDKAVSDLNDLMADNNTTAVSNAGVISYTNLKTAITTIQGERSKAKAQIDSSFG